MIGTCRAQDISFSLHDYGIVDLMASISSSDTNTKPILLDKEGRQALATAQAIATAYGQKFLTTNHILLGILETPGAAGASILGKFPIKLDQLKTRLWAYIQLDSGTDKTAYGGEFYGFPLSEDGAKALAEAVSEAEEHHLTAIDSPTLVLGILRSLNTSAGEILRQFDIHATEYRQRAATSAHQTAPAVTSRQPRLRGRKASRTNGYSLPAISPIFLLLLAILGGVGYLLYAGIGEPGRLTFLFVLVGWIVAVSLHEFGHALAAYFGGDESVAHKGYLTLDPLKYTNPLMSIIFPVIFLLLGGIPLPGGAVYINRAAIRKRWMHSVVSAAGPLATLLFGIALLLPFVLGLADSGAHSVFWEAISLLAFFQIFAFVLNLIPWPGLDGFGILEPYLPPNILRFAYMFSGLGIFLFFMLFVYTPFGQWIGLSVWSLMSAISHQATVLAYQGFDLFFFWK
ncbi:MAG: hypothetical protein DSY55_05865 [Clostridia bacterium]|nr:MAG: hypothetical protein DSY55_05865 [Clostridia bacterium]